MSSKNSNIFISYRRADNPDFVEHIRTWFILRYARENVFMDFDSIPPFVKFGDYIEEKIQESHAVVIIIGPLWTKLMREKAARYEDDYVRMEVNLAIKHNKVIAPICVKGAMLPDVHNLPDDIKPLLETNVAYLNSGTHILNNIEKIMDELDIQIAIRFERIEELLNLAEKQYKLGKVDTAIDIYSNIIKIDSKQVKAYNNRGLLYHSRNELESAIEDYSIILSTTTLSRETTYHNRGLAFYEQNRLSQAIEDFSAAIKLSENIQFYISRGRAYCKNNQYQEAVEDFTRVIEKKSNSDKAFTYRGLTFLIIGEHSKAVPDILMAKKLKPQNIEITVALSVAYHLAGNREKALNSWKPLKQKSKNFQNKAWVSKNLKRLDWPQPVIDKVGRFIELLSR